MKTPLIIKLDFEDDDLFAGTDAIALVENPAIETDFFTFDEEFQFKTYTDYPKAVTEAAKRGIRLNEKVNNKCATRVGKIRAKQLADGKPISEQTITRMFAYLSRAIEFYDPSDTEACGTISYLLWGGEPALRWSERKLKQIEKEKEMSAQNEIEDSNIGDSDTLASADFAERGPRGGIKPSKKAPKSKTKNPNPKGEGTAKGNAGTSRGAKVDAQSEKALRKKADEFNEKYKEKLGYVITIGQLKAVFQRGLGAYNTSRSPAVAARGGAKQWAQARVNAFLYLVKNGRPQNKKYTTDYDLLPTKHPKRTDMEAALTALFNDMKELPVSQQDEVNQFLALLSGPGCEDDCDCGCQDSVDNAGEIFCDVDGGCRDKSEYTTSFAVVDADEQMIVSPVMIPNMPIARRDEEGELFYVYFSEDTVQRMAHKFLTEKRVDRFNIEHDASTSLGGINLVESWVSANKNDKSKKYGYGDLPAGTWFVQLKVCDTNLWKMIKEGIVKGLSLEGTFNQKKINYDQNEFVSVKTEGGTRLFVKEDSLVTFIVDKDGNLASVAPDGDYTLDDGTLLRVVDGKANKFPS